MAEIEFLGRLSDIFETPIEKTLPAHIKTITDLRRWLGAELGHDQLDQPTIRAIVNQKIAPDNQPISNEDMIAFYPPVGGG